ncbi:uncharacterized protein EV154DRAFT_511736 [Mucor mucedo]|uniref:Uncharacterized protein n=1 Tax=Mucor saturninus TaxID=64648 RepID=A0A8H7R424_9FUNG|nr:uncharacterized protein EV154DRAFT_511736 [Mucor mucedo]KAG2203485.1 hypothetical protein INT47_008212 [Mucor saturninus]KAI7890325.1 hypothetical protein EV154DRAFT_511736 [Mucor mucedo]
MRFSLIFIVACLMTFCCASKFEEIDQHIVNMTLQHDFTDESTTSLKQRFVLDSSSTTPISTDPILALVIFVALSSIMF